MKSHLCLLSLLLICSTQLFAQRKDLLIDDNWTFRFSHQVELKSGIRVDLPHTWNAQDALSGKIDYKRGIGNYTRKLTPDSSWQGKRVFLRFEGANSVANLFVNGKNVGEHRGGYGAFCFEITDRINADSDNDILVRVNNAEQLDVMPLVGDFNFYGGLYRDVHLILTSPVCISPVDYASSGVYLTQQSVDDKRAEVQVKTMLCNSLGTKESVTVRVDLFDGTKLIDSRSTKVDVEAGAINQAALTDLSIRRPHLWNGTDDPFCYRVVVTLVSDGNQIDSIEQPLGLRYYSVDPNEGFSLNGRHLALHGVCRHQDRAETGNALLGWHHREDVALMREMGVNAVRLAHYPQATAMYDQCDRNGLVVWAEIPFVGPGGYGDKGFVDSPSFRQNGCEQLRELIRQHYNHPSICFWGLFNELKASGDDPVDYIGELNDLAHSEDHTRPTTAASNQSGPMNFVTDLIAWNRYDGWYGSTTATLGEWLDATHAQYPDIKIAVSEYGAGASIRHQQQQLVQPVPTSRWHPENWQTFYHIESFRTIAERKYVWGSFVWNMFDFGAAHRTEGDRVGINDKGLVTFDRKVRKDAFYFYKSNWNPEPMIHIAGKRLESVDCDSVEVLVFCNAGEVTLSVNGAKVASVVPDQYRICRFQNVALTSGENLIEATAADLADSYTLRRQ